MLKKRKHIVFKKAITLLMAVYFLSLPVLSAVEVNTCTSACPMFNSEGSELVLNPLALMTHTQTCKMDMKNMSSTANSAQHTADSCKNISVDPFAATMKTFTNDLASVPEVPAAIVSYKTISVFEKSVVVFSHASGNRFVSSREIKLSTVLLI